MALTDSELARRVREREPAAGHEFVDAYAPLIQSAVACLCSSRIGQTNRFETPSQKT